MLKNGLLALGPETRLPAGVHLLRRTERLGEDDKASRAMYSLGSL